MNEPDTDRLLTALRSPAAYRHPVEEVRVIETHISQILLTGEYAYKLKKPVDLGFVDFTTLERRRFFCDEELRLNRRFASDLYLDIVPIAGTPDAPVVGGSGEPIEFAVRMRQFPQEALLSWVVARGQLTTAHVDALAEETANFHGRIPVAAPESPFGSPERVWRPAEENFEHLGPESEGDALVRRLKEWSRHEFRQRREDFAARKALGFVRECHGDMHLGNMLLLDGQVTIFDCIEFNDDFRWIDVQSDIAFAVMDLEDRGRPDYARRLLNAYLERTGDYAGLSVLPFYLTYRAMVRAKVASIRSRQPDVGGEEQARQACQCRSYLELAERYTQQPRPLLIVTYGVSGSGKTTATQPVVERLGAVRVRSDIERKRLFGKQPPERSGPDLDTGLYSPEATARTYGRVAELAQAILRAGFPAVVDATFLKRDRRRSFRRLAEKLGIPFVILDLRADEAVLRERVERRHREGDDASDADLAVLEHQLRTREPLTPDETGDAIPVEADRPDAVAEACARLTALCRGESFTL